MPNSPDKPKAAAIHVEGCKDVYVADNISVGAPVLHAADVEGLTAVRNRSLQQPEPTPAPAIAKRWYERPVGVIALGIIISVAAGGILFAFGWN